MSKTVEFGDTGFRVVDTTAGIVASLLTRFSGVSVTVESRKTVTIANSTTDQAIQFDSVSAGKILVLVPDGAITLKVNGSSVALPVTTVYSVVDTAGGITAATMSNASGASRTVEVLVAG